MNRTELYNLIDKLERAIINKAFACQQYDDTLNEFMREVLKHYPLECSNPNAHKKV